MKIETETVDRAFEAFHRRYVAEAKRTWDLDHHSILWADARSSVESDADSEGFLRTLGNLRSYWQITRGKGAKVLPFEDILPLLRKKAEAQKATRLSAITERDIPQLFRLVNEVADIKRVKGKPSLMAISKVLHFYNPRLFVIVDRAMVWDWALAHPWIWRPFEDARMQVDKIVECDASERDDSACDAASYVAILIGSGQLLRDNPHVPERFASFLKRHTTPEEAKLPGDLESYEAAAVEWLLLGLVELPPKGVEL